MTPNGQGIGRRRFLARAAVVAGGAIATAAAVVAPPVGRAATPPTPTDTRAPRRGTPAISRRQAVKLRVARFGSTETAMYEQGIYADFKQLQPDIDLEIYAVPAPDWNGYLDQIIAQIKAGKGPDAAYVATEGTQVLAGQGYAAALDPYVMRDRAQLREYFADVAPVLIEAMMMDGHLYELPSDFNAVNLFYNRAVFARRGVPPPTETWTKDDFAAAMPKLTEQVGGRTTAYGFSWTNRLFGGALPWFALNDGGILVEDKVARSGDWLWQTFYHDDPAATGRSGGWRWGQSRANDARNVEALQFLVGLTYQTQAAPAPAPPDSLQTEDLKRFGAAQLATFPSGAFSVSGIHDAKIGPNDYDVTYMPKWRTQRHQFGTAGYAMLAKSANKDATWEFLKYRIRKETIAATVKGGASAPARRSLANATLWTADLGPKNWHVFYDTLDTLPDTTPLPAPPQANEVTAIFTKYIGQAMSREQTPQAALDQMHRELTDVMNQ